MKKAVFRLSLLVLCGLLSVQLCAQKGFMIGPTAGLTFSKAGRVDRAANEFTNKIAAGYTGGLHIHYGWKDRLGLTTGINFTNKGYRFENDSNSLEKTIKRDISYIEIPLGIHFRQEINNRTFIRERFGFGVGFSLDRKDSLLLSNGSPGTFQVVELEKNSLSTFFQLGLEVQTQTGGGHYLLFGLHYIQGTNRLLNLDLYDEPTLSNKQIRYPYLGSYLTLSVTYMINFKSLKKEEEFFYD